MNQFEQDVITRYQEKLAALAESGMEKDAISGGKWLGAYANRLKGILSGTNYGRNANQMLEISKELNNMATGVNAPSSHANIIAGGIGATLPFAKLLDRAIGPYIK